MFKVFRLREMGFKSHVDVLLALANLASSLPLRSFLFIILSCMQFFFSFFFSFLLSQKRDGMRADHERLLRGQM